MSLELNAKSAAAVLVVAAVWAAGISHADEPKGLPEHIGGLTFRDEIELTVVNIDVNVTDDGGRPITDLTADDFEIFQDGQRRNITNFRPYTKEIYRQYSEPAAAPGPPPSNEVVGDGEVEIQPVWIVLYVDHQNLDPMQRNRVLNQTRAFVRENLGPSVRMMVVSRKQTAKVVQDFTSDSNLVLEALRDMRLDTGGRPSLVKDRNEIIQTIQTREYNPSNLNDQQALLSRIRNFAREETTNLTFSLQSLREIMSMLAGLEGKKAVFYVSNGIPFIPGMGLFHAYAAAFDESDAYHEAVSYKQTQAFDSLVSAANSLDITLYTIDAGGLRMPGVATAEYRDSEDHRAATVAYQNNLDSLRFLARETGGIAIVDTNDVGPWLERVEHDFYTYYSIGYPIQQAGSDKIHKIRVRLPDHPQYNLRYRRVFAEKSLESRIQEKVVTSLVLPLDDNPMSLELSVGTATVASEDRWTVPLTVVFPATSVALVPDGEDYVGRVVLFFAVRDTDGGQSEVIRQERELWVSAAAAESIPDRRFTLKASLLMKGGRHVVAVGMLDQVTRQASYRIVRTSVPSS